MASQTLFQSSSELSASQRQQSSVAGSQSEDGWNSEGTLKLAIPNLSQLEGAILSRPVKIQNLPWHLMVTPRELVSSSQDVRGKALGVFVQCVPEESAVGLGWSVTARVKVSLLSHVDPARSSCKEFTYTYSAQQNDWGYSSFIKWKNLMDPSKGFVKDDSILVQAHVTAETPTVNPSPSLPPPATSHDTPSLLSCPVCYEDFQTVGSKRPATLKCGHTFCQECLQKGCVKVEGRLQLKCSLCNQEHSASSEGRLWFPNYSLVQVIGNVVPKSKYFCSTHQHDQKYYCFDDHSLVCIYCAYHGEHSGHRCEHIDDARAEVEAYVTAAKLQASSSVAELEQGVCILKDEVMGLKTQEKSVTQLVEKFFSDIETAILRQKEHLLQQLRAHTVEIGSSLEAKIRDLEDRRSEASKVLAEYLSWQALPPREALVSSSGLQSKLRALSTSANRNLLSTGYPQRISFELPYSDVLTQIGLLGRLNVSHSQDNRGEDSEGTQKVLAGESSGLTNIRGTSPSSTDSSPSALSPAEGLKDMQEYEIESPAKKRRK